VKISRIKCISDFAEMHFTWWVNRKPGGMTQYLVADMMLPCDDSCSSVLVGAHARVLLLALKTLKRPRSFEQRACMEQRLRALEGLQHPNVVRYLGNNLASGDDEITLVMQAWGVSLSSLVASKQHVGSLYVFDFVLHILSALVCLHGAGIVHGDVKTANVLYHGGVYKLCDVDEGGTGTAFYMSARRARRHPQASSEDTFSDTYALGLSTLEVYTGSQPYSEIDNQLVVFARVCAGEFPRSWSAVARSGYDQGCVSIVQAMLDSDIFLTTGSRASPQELIDVLLLLRQHGEL